MTLLGDTDDTTALHVPSIGLVVAGDTAHNDVHLYLAGSPNEGRKAWLAALDTLEDLAPSAVVAGHERADRADDPRIVEETRRYMAAAPATVEQTYTTPIHHNNPMDRTPPRRCGPARTSPCGLHAERARGAGHRRRGVRSGSGAGPGARTSAAGSGRRAPRTRT